MKGTIEQLKAARMVGTPLVGITTSDQPALVLAIVRAYQGGTNDPPLCQWDLVRGMVGLNEVGANAVALLAPVDDVLGAQAAVLPAPVEALGAAARLPRRALLVIHNAAALLENAAVVQAICNLRDVFKADGRTLVLLDAALPLPAVLASDVFTIEEPLPTDDQIAAIIETELTNAQGMATPPETPDADTKQRAVEALSGLAAFSCEQAVALSLLDGKLSPPVLWERKRREIRQTRGLSMDDGTLTFADIGGQAALKEFSAQFFAGPRRPRVIVRVDEIEKMMAGVQGDTSGVAQDAHGALLREMEDMKWPGIIAVGPPGSGKSAFTQALGPTYGVPTLAIDMGSAKGSLVGQSEERIRTMLRVIKAMAGKWAYWVATCNKLDVLSPEFRRRFKFGVWYFDLPDAEERKAIWTICLRMFGLDASMPRPRDERWTGAEIRNCCELAWSLQCSLIEAARYIVPVATADPQGIERLRQSAHQKWLSVSTPGFYVHAGADQTGRALAQAAGTVQAFTLPGRAYGES